MSTLTMPKRMTRILLMILVGIGLFTTLSCSSAWSYPGHAHAELARSYWVKTDYVPGAIYRLREPVFLFRWPDDSRPELALIGEHRFSFGYAPQTILRYQQDGPHRWRAVKAMLPAGTTIRFESFQFVKDDGIHAFAIATATDGELAKLGVFSISGISRYVPGPIREVWLDPQYLEAVDPQIRGTAAGFLEVTDIDPKTGLGSVPKPVDEARARRFMEDQEGAQEEQAVRVRKSEEQIRAATQRAPATPAERR